MRTAFAARKRARVRLDWPRIVLGCVAHFASLSRRRALRSARHTGCSCKNAIMRARHIGILSAFVLAATGKNAGAQYDPADGALFPAEQGVASPESTTDDTRRSSETTAPYDWRMSGTLGGFSDDNEDGGVSLGATFKVRSNLFAAGALVEFSSALFSYDSISGAAVGGLSARVERNVRLELLGLGGYRHYAGVGRSGLLGSDPGASGGTPYVGARSGASYLFGRRPGLFELGAYVGIDRDLGSERVHYSYEGDGGWLFGGGGESAQTVGGLSRLALGVELGGTHEWF